MAKWTVEQRKLDPAKQIWLGNGVWEVQAKTAEEALKYVFIEYLNLNNSVWSRDNRFHRAFDVSFLPGSCGTGDCHNQNKKCQNQKKFLHNHTSLNN